MEQVCLTSGQRQHLEALARGSRDGQQVRRGQALVWLNRGEGVGSVAARLGVTRQAVWHWKRRGHPGQGTSLNGLLADRPKSGRPPRRGGR